MLFFIVLIIVFSFFQATFLQLDVVTWLVLWVLISWPVRKAWLMGLLAGLIIDLIAGRELGWTSGIYLLIGLFLYFYGKRYSAFHPVFLFLFISGSILVVNWVLGGSLIWIEAVVISALGVLLRKYLREAQTGEGQLRLEYGP